MSRIWEYVINAIQKQVLFNPSYVQSFPSELARPSMRPPLTAYQLQCLHRYCDLHFLDRPFKPMFRCLVQPENEDNPEGSFRNIIETAIIDSEMVEDDETPRAEALIENIFNSNPSYLRFQFAFENYTKSTEELIRLYAKYEGQPIVKNQIKSSKMEQTLVEFDVTYDNNQINIQGTGFRCIFEEINSLGGVSY